MRKLSAILCALMLALLLTACGGQSAPAADGSAESPAGTEAEELAAEAEEPGAAGVYTLTEIISPESAGISRSEVSLMEGQGLVCWLELREDGTFTLDAYGDVTEGAWDENGVTAGGETQRYTLEGDTLTMTNSTGALLFRRSTREAVDALLARAADTQATEEDAPAGDTGE